MKRNVDLTSQEMFSRRSGLAERLIRIPKLWWLDNTPAPIREYPLYEAHGRISVRQHRDAHVRELIFTGSSESRAYKRMMGNIDSGDYCDCCGRSLIIIPWKRRYGLCDKCSVSLDESLGIRKSTKVFFDTSMQADRSKNPFRF